MTERCNCENSNCPHGESPCHNDACDIKVLFVGRICEQCAHHYPLDYFVKDEALQSWIRRDWLNNPNRS